MLSLHMGWRHALFANWAVDPELVAAHLPDSLAVDTFDGRGWLSVVPFTNVDVRPAAFPDGTGIRLPELNLRTYVTRNDDRGDDWDDDRGDDWDDGRGDDRDRGVYFFSLDAQGLLSVLGARVAHHLPYYYARSGLSVDGDRIRFASRRLHPGARPVAFEATYRPQGTPERSAAGSLERFLVDRRRLFTEAQDGTLRATDVDHPPWRVQDVELEPEFEAGPLFRANGFAEPAGEPVCFYSPGVDTVASPSRRVDARGQY